MLLSVNKRPVKLYRVSTALARSRLIFKSTVRSPCERCFDVTGVLALLGKVIQLIALFDLMVEFRSFLSFKPRMNKFIAQD